MRKHLLLGLMAFVALSAAQLAAEIVAVQENGRTVYVDVPSQAKNQPVAAAPTFNTGKIPMYWSKTERRWKRVPPATGATMRRARSAAADVAQLVMAREQQPAAAAEPEAKAKPATRENIAAERGIELPKSDAAKLDVEVPASASRLITAEQLDQIIEETAAKHGVDSNLVRAVIKVESNFNPRARSRKGAIGLMQLMPSTARELNVNPYDPAQNLDGGIRHIKSLLEQNGGDVSLSLAAYNAGQGAVNRHGGVPRYKETQSYVKRITEMYAGNNALGGTFKSQIRVTRDADGHRVYTND